MGGASAVTGTNAAPIVYVGAGVSTVDDSPGVFAAVQSALAAGTRLVIRGSLNPATTVQLTSAHAGAFIEFEDAQVTDKGTSAGFIRANNVPNLQIRADADTSFTGFGSSGAKAAFNILGTTTYLLELYCTFNSYTTANSAFILLAGSCSGRIFGWWRTADSMFLISTTSGSQDISGFRTIDGGYTSAPPQSQVVYLNGPAAGTPGPVYIHDYFIDGGSQVANSGGAPVSILGINVTFPVVHVANGGTQNLGSGPISSSVYSDGLDIRNATKVVVHGMSCDGAGDGIGVGLSSDVTVYGCVSRNCRWFGVQCGDPTVQTSASGTYCITAVIADACGQSASGNIGSFGVVTSTAGSIGTATFANCQCVNIGASKYGLSVYNAGSSGTIGTVSWTGGLLAGATAPWLSSAGSGTIGTVAVSLPAMPSISSLPTNPSTTASATFVNAGLSNPASEATPVPLIFPIGSGRVEVTITGAGGNNTAADAGNARPVYGLLNASPANYLGAWSGATAYVPGNVVLSGTTYYICILANTNQTPPNATYWMSIQPPAAGAGPTGTVVGTGFAFAVGNNPNQGFAFTFEVTLSPGAVYFVDLEQEVVTGGTFALKNLYVTVKELPTN